MKAAILAASDTAPEYDEFPEPTVADGLELADLVAAGIHPFVRSAATGQHYGSTGTWPLIPGVDAVARTAEGDFIFTGFVRPPYGTLAERMAIPKAMRFSLPSGADPVAVAGGMNPGLSSWMPLKARVTKSARSERSSFSARPAWPDRSRRKTRACSVQSSSSVQDAIANDSSALQSPA